MSRVRRRMLLIAASAAALVAALTVPLATSAAWSGETTFVAQTVVPATAPSGPFLGPIEPHPGTTINDVEWQVSDNRWSDVCMVVDVTGVDGWSFDVPFAAPPLWGGGTAAVISGGIDMHVQPGDRLTFTSATPTPNARICLSPTGVPGHLDDAYDTVISDPVQVDIGRVCVDISVTGRIDLADFPFAYGWQVPLDLRPINAIHAANGRVPTWASVSADGNVVDYDTWAPGMELMMLRNTVVGSLRGTESLSGTVCVMS